MTSPISEDRGPLKEWAPLVTLLQKVPSKIQVGLFYQDVNFTCIDVVPEFIVIGTNYGLVYWYNRQNGELQKLHCENFNSSITCVHVISTVDFMVAAGSNNGTVTIFQIPKEISDNVPESLKPKRKRQIERFNVSGLHKTSVITVEWSKNGMKLFSGDQDGLVVATEIDFYMHLSKSFELVNEKYPVVQLSYFQGLLLVSTLFRTIIVDRNQSDKVTQVGQKERKTLGKFGSIFFKKSNHPQELIIYATRPGLRIWEADKTGTVLKTLIFKDAIRSANSQVELLNPANQAKSKTIETEPTFGVILPFSEELIVTYHEDVIYVVNPTTITITSAITKLRKIINVACSKDEIFVLEGHRNIVRIAYHPETCSFNTTRDSPIDPLTALAESSKPVTSGILELTSKFSASSIVPNISFHKINPANLMQSISIIPPVTVGMDVNSIINAEEAIEVPPVLPLDINTSLVTEINVHKDQTTQENKTNDRKQIFRKIAEQDFEEVVFTPTKKTRKAVKKSFTNDLDNMSQKKKNKILEIQEMQKNTSVTTTHSSLMDPSNDNLLVPQCEKNLELIQKDVENKEKLLSDILTFDLSEYMTRSHSIATTSKCDANRMTSSDYYCDSSYLTEKKNTANFDTDNIQNVELDEESEESSYKTELVKLQNLTESNKQTLKNIKESSTSNQNRRFRTNEISSVIEESISEKRFNDLSKKFVMSAIGDDDDWVLIG